MEASSLCNQGKPSEGTGQMSGFCKGLSRELAHNGCARFEYDRTWKVLRSSMAGDVSAYAERSKNTVEGKVRSCFLLPLPP